MDFLEDITASLQLSSVGSGELDHEANDALVTSATGSRISQQSARKKIAMLAHGTRGDIQPFIALAMHLKASGFRVLVLTNVNHSAFLEKFGLEHRAVLGNVEERLKHPSMQEFMATGNLKSCMKALKDLEEVMKAEFVNDLQKERQALEEYRADLLLSTPLELLNGIVFGRLFEIPVIQCALQPSKPTRHLRSFLNEPAFSDFAWKLCFRETYKSIRAQKLPVVQEMFGPELGGEQVWPDFASYMNDVMHPIAPELIGFSSSILPRPSDWPSSLDPVRFTGFWVIGKEEQTRRLECRDSNFGGDAADALESFLAAGEPPVYLGWGSMTPGSPERMARLAVQSLKLAGRRGIILGGWAKLSMEMLRGQPDERELLEYASEHVLFVDTAPHEWLFPRCAVTVHHGGAGTTAAALRSGNPTVITPCFLDQFNNAELVAKSGCGLRMPQFRKVTAAGLGRAIVRCCTEEAIRARARCIGEALQREDGLACATRAIDEFLEGDVASGAWRARFEQRRRSRAPTRAGCCRRRAESAVAEPEQRRGGPAAGAAPLPTVLGSQAASDCTKAAKDGEGEALGVGV